MANYYVSNARGSDTTGTGSATAPWKTIDKAIGSSPAITLSGTGDTLYIEPGLYREAVTLGLSPTTGGPLSIVGDCDGAGFLADGYSTPATGLVDWRSWTDDLTANTSGPVIDLNNKSYVTLSKLQIIGGTWYYSGIYQSGATWKNVTVQDCIVFAIQGASACGFISTSAAAVNLTVERCTLVGATGINLSFAYSSSEYSAAVLVQNCRFFSPSFGIYMTADSGSGTKCATGVSIINCETPCSGGYFLMLFESLSIVLASPIVLRGCKVGYCQLSSNVAGNIDEDYCYYTRTSVYTNVTGGSHSKLGVCPAFDVGTSILTGLPHRPLGEPLAANPYSGVGNGGTTVADDLTGRTRPEGGGSTAYAVGALERHDTGVKDATYEDAGSNGCLELVGPASQDRPLLVDAAATVISIKVRWDGNHGDTNKPQAILLANPEIGVASQTVTATSAGGTGSTPNSYETLTFSSITPTAAGVVMLRMVSRSAAGNGAAYFDTIAFA